ncbi:MAG TPA: AMP-binding protein [Candidatus Acidoferrum sp.]|nr:AMP-binding protein [Candidatus Acidoferrum sp.]
MANFLENVFAELQKAAERVVLREVRGDKFVSVSGRELLDLVARARAYLRQAGVQTGDRCALLGPNSIRWVAFDLALMAEGAIVVPLYARQAANELAGMMKDCGPRLLIVSDAALGEAVAAVWPQAPARVTFDEVLGNIPAGKGITAAPNSLRSEDLVTIIYTSGTSGEPKGVCLNVRNLDHMLACTTQRLDQLMGATREPDRVFHYLPFSFAGSWILLLTCISRESALTLSTDLNRLADEIRVASPHYSLNVPTLLERVRRGVLDALAQRDTAIQKIFQKAQQAWEHGQKSERRAADVLWLFLGRKLIFSKIRARFGPHLRALICGSAPLAPETQQFFQMLGISVLQGYGLTETTALCTLDDPRIAAEPGRVGEAVPGIEMRSGENEEILVRGPNIFPGYWNRVLETEKALKDGWFHTGDQGEVNSRGNWRISGRIKNLLILNSGHNIAPEPIEEELAQRLAEAQQIVLVGNGRGYLCALVTGAVEEKAVQSALDTMNSELPHYRQVRSFTILREPFTPESGLLTANGKLRRDAINEKYREEIEQMYRKQAVAAGGKA